MPTSHEIDAETWAHARESLVYYFFRRGLRDPEDLANETLLTIWMRADYVFERKEDFLRVCYGFADKIRRQGYRRAQMDFLNISHMTIESPSGNARGLRGAEIPVFLKEVRQTTENSLRQHEKDFIDSAATDEMPQALGDRDTSAANRFRVGLHRARRKLAKLTGWDAG